MKDQTYDRGFTLVEVIITLFLLGTVLGIGCRIFLTQAEAHKTQSKVILRQQGLRVAMEIIARELKSAGYPLKEQFIPETLPSWIPGSFIPRAPQQVAPSGIITVTPGSDNPDILSLLIVLDSESNPTTLGEGTLAGDTVIRLSLTGSQSDEQYNVSDMVFIGKPAEMALVKGISGNSLIIDTDPVQAGNQGLKKSYPPGTEVGEISLVSYAVFTDNNDPGGASHELGIPVLKRKTNACGFEPLVENIIDLKVVPLPKGLYQLQLTAATGPSRSGKPKHLSMTSRVMIRN
jgi:prepilin-type N-terminal cleavage/methylation domain-containing protein